jgi:hypothetical protein
MDCVIYNAITKMTVTRTTFNLHAFNKQLEALGNHA